MNGMDHLRSGGLGLCDLTFLSRVGVHSVGTVATRKSDRIAGRPLFKWSRTGSVPDDRFRNLFFWISIFKFILDKVHSFTSSRNQDGHESIFQTKFGVQHTSCGSGYMAIRPERS